MFTDSSAIAFFDSGMGGLTVLQEALQVLPHEHYIYFADSTNAPYGTKSSIEILELVEHWIEFIVHRHSLKALVIACNTATSVAIQQLRASYNFPIIGMEPALKPALQVDEKKTVLICATEKTLVAPKLQALANKLGAEKRIQRLSLQGLVPFAEQQEWDSIAVHQYLKQQFHGINWTTIQAVVLGCTHFPYYKKVLRNYIPIQLPILDGHTGTVRHLKTCISPAAPNQAYKLVYYQSGKLHPNTQLLPYLNHIRQLTNCF